MFNYPDGKIAQPLILELDSAGTAAGDIELGPDVYFVLVRAIAAEDDSALIWRPALPGTDTAALASASCYSVPLAAEGEVYETPMMPATQRPARLRFACSAGSARVEVLRVVRQ